MLFLQFILFFASITGYNFGPCKSKSYGSGKIVCVCSESYCDDLVTISPRSGKSILYETNKNGARFHSSELNFDSSISKDIPLLIFDESVIFQFILGFGGAFTDATGINLNILSPKLQNMVMESYFGENGLEYTMGRVPIASCDFSTYPYSYDDVAGDLDLKHFQIAKEDFLFKIPYIRAASNLTKDPLLLLASPWSAPGWMKTNNEMEHGGILKGQPGGPYFKAWANYLVRFIQEYGHLNISMWGLTLQNEPNSGCVANYSFQSMCFPPELQRDFLKKDLGPALHGAGLSPLTIRLLIVDEARLVLPHWADVIMSDAYASQWVSGVAFHWYYEDLAPHRLLNITHAKHPSLFFLSTEACTGYSFLEYPKVDLGSWSRAERYAHDIMQDLLNWSIGWLDWNLVLDLMGGPNWVNNFVDSPIIINAQDREFYKQPMYYALAHFSKVLPRGSQRVHLQKDARVPEELEVGAFRKPNGQRVLIALNREDVPVQVALYDPTIGYLNISVPGHSIQSYVWRK